MNHLPSNSSQAIKIINFLKLAIESDMPLSVLQEIFKEAAEAVGLQIEILKPPNSALNSASGIAIHNSSVTILIKEGIEMSQQNGDNIEIKNKGMMAGVAAGRGARAVVEGDIHQIQGPAAPGAPADEAEFRKDVTEVLHALVDAKEKLETEIWVKFLDIFKRLEAVEVKGKTIEQAQAAVLDKWVEQKGQELRPALAGLGSTEFFKTLMGSTVLSAIVTAASK